MARIVLWLMLLATPAFSQPVLHVGTASATAGLKTTGYIDVPSGVDAGMRIPVVVVAGARPGPALAIVSGAHGTEYASIIAVEKLIELLDPQQISGSVILVPLVNQASFEQKVPHVNPIDGKSMNRFYPGKPDGTQTERAAYAITREVVEKCDHLIDLHGGDLDENLRPYSYWAPTGKSEQDRISRDMALAFGLDTIIISRDRPSDPNASKYLETTASLRGKASITAEAGRAGRVDTDDVMRLVNGCMGVMRYLKMLAGSADAVQHPVWIDHVETLTSDATGIFYPEVDRGVYVEKGSRIGHVTDYTNRTVMEARAPAAGVVLYICALPSMTKGATIANIGVIAAGAPQ
ncbi:MAG TPA: succinylglutamate desuccinylase/aspartoacylase family protein [Terriglobales bacterium]|nr:succinylglutamate desuccinylase/aspartoacylase family protein [Terriglobales bacterium]